VPFGLSRLAGITFPEKGALVVVLFIVRTRPKYGLVDLSSSLKSPLRMARLGTTPVFVVS